MPVLEVLGGAGGQVGDEGREVAYGRDEASRDHRRIDEEATSALDPESERALCTTLERFRGQVTVLAISHQTALVDTADRVYRLSEGHATLEVDRLSAPGS